jgi:hypothetical protein
MMLLALMTWLPWLLLQRVADGQAFTQRLLSERTGSAGNATHSER